MRSFVLAGLLLCLSFSFAFTVKAQELPWQFRFKKDDISVYTRKLDSALLEFKSDMVVPVPIDVVVALYEDWKMTPQWYYECVKMEMLKDEGPLTKVFYFVMDPPWPVSQRDAVFRRYKSIDASTGVVSFRLTALPEAFPQQKGRIRVPYLDITFRFTPIGQDKTEIYFQQHGEAGGYIPAFIANSLVIDTPLKSLRSFRELVERRMTTQIVEDNQKVVTIEAQHILPEWQVILLNWKDKILEFFGFKQSVAR